MSNTAWMITDVVQLSFMIGMHKATKQEQIKSPESAHAPSKCDEIGWKLALYSALLIEPVSILFYLLSVLPLGYFPEWFFTKWAALDWLNNECLSLIYFTIMMV